MNQEIKVVPYRWVVLIAFMLITFVVEIQWLAHAAVARPAEVFYSGQFDPNSFLNIDFLAMIYMLVYLIMSIPASYMIDTYGIRVGIGIGTVIAGAAGLLKAVMASSFLGVVVAQTGFAIAQPFILNAVTAVSVRWFSLHERGLAAGLAVLAQYLGIIVAMLVTPVLIVTDPELPGYGSGFVNMLWTYGILTLMAALVALVLIKERPPTAPSGEKFIRQNFSDGLRHILKQRDMQITLVLFLIGLGIFNAISSMTDSIAENLGVKDSDGLIGGLMLIGGVFGAIIMPVLSDRFRMRKRFLVICMIGAVPGIFGLTFTHYFLESTSLTYGIALGSSCVLGFFVMSAGPIGFQYAAEVSHPAPESTSQGLLLWVGQITGLLFVGGMSIRQNIFLNGFMITFFFLSLISVVGVLLIRESPMMKKDQTNIKKIR